MANIDIEGILKGIPNDGRVPKTKIVCTLGPASRSVPMLEKLLRDGMNVARKKTKQGNCNEKRSDAEQKAKKKQVDEEIFKLSTKLKERHAEELASLDYTSSGAEN
ncbi:Pyruvate kinase [Forsythia ovata]|uniref:Pyruvate kinase n=1 Tax=Forsythia ovata TaxID=205694 RepID=A0ABD1RYL4_9LAMI